MKSIMYLSIVYFVIMGTAIATSMAQTIAGVSVTQPNPVKLDSLFQKLASDSEICMVPEYYFGPTYDDDLVDLIVYVDETDPLANNAIVHIKLLKGSQHVSELYGERTLYVIVFWKTRDKSSSDFFNPDVIPISMSALDQKTSSGEFALFAALNFITSTFASHSLSGAQKEELNDRTSIKSPVTYIGSLTGDHLYLGFGKLSLQENTINRVHVGGSGTNNTCLATFGNYSPSWITTSVGILETFKRKKDETVVTDLPRFDAFLFGHLYLKRPQLPHPRFRITNDELNAQVSYSFVVGTRISKNVMEDIFIGFCMGHIYNKMSLVVGSNLRMLEGEKEKKWIGFPSMGFSYMF